MSSFAIQTSTPEAYQLFHEGTLALADVERAGIKIDTEYLDRAIDEVGQQIKAEADALQQDELFRLWRRRFGSKTKLGDYAQIASVIYDDLGVECTQWTSGGKSGKQRRKADKGVTEKVDHPFVKRWVEWQKLRKARSTYLVGLRREMVDGYIHPSFHLNLVDTFRSSASDPNVQNQPARDKFFVDLIKRSFIARGRDRVFLEIDESQIEVRVGECYHHDPVMLAYLLDKSKDMHRDMAMQCYMLPSKDAQQKNVRGTAKGAFVFASFYGSYWAQTAAGLWEAIGRDKLTRTDGVGLAEHLRSKGIQCLGVPEKGSRPVPGSFAAHIQRVEQDFWGNRFKGYADWKEEWFAQYQRDGGFRYLTGFWVEGVLSKNQVVNYPIQGCLPGSSRVLTEKGWVPIKELEGEVTRVWTGFKWADAMGLSRGKCRRARVHLSSGLVVECDTRHKFKNTNMQWVGFQDLKVGERVALPRTGEVLEYSGKVNWPFVFGFIIGDGYLRKKEHETTCRRAVTITVGETKMEDLLRIREFLIRQGCRPRYRVIPADPASNRKEKYSLTLEDRFFSAFMEERGFDFDWKAGTKRIPESVWRMSPQDQRDFMEGLWLSDGSRSAEWGKHNLHMCNLALLQDVQKLIVPLGFDSHITYTSSGVALHVLNRKHNAKPTRKYPVGAIRRYVPGRPDRGMYEIANQHTTDTRSLLQGNVSQFVGERIVEINGPPDAEIYRFDSVTQIEVLDEEEETFTMSVDDPLHQFVADGVVCKNSAFHVLLWALIQLNRWLKKHRMRTCIVGQVHDSLLIDAHVDELEDVVAAASYFMTRGVQKHWPWLEVPLEVEAEASPPGGSWAEKTKLEIPVVA